MTSLETSFHDYPEVPCGTPTPTQPSTRDELDVSGNYNIDWKSVISSLDGSQYFGDDATTVDKHIDAFIKEYQHASVEQLDYLLHRSRGDAPDAINPYSLIHLRLDELACEYFDKPLPFENNPMGLHVMYNNYSRLTNWPVKRSPDGKPRVVAFGPNYECKESWVDIVVRVVFGTLFSICQSHARMNRSPFSDVPWIDDDGQIVTITQPQLARELMDAVFHLRFCPPGRGLFASGTSLIFGRKIGAALNNCAFTSTALEEPEPVSLMDYSKVETILSFFRVKKTKKTDYRRRKIHHIEDSKETERPVYQLRGIRNIAQAVAFLMDHSMLGVGVGFDTKGAGQFRIYDSAKNTKILLHYTIPDTREGWVMSTFLLLFLNTTAGHGYDIALDYSLIRPPGARISTFGGTSAGGKVLEELHGHLRGLFTRRHRQLATSRDIVDIMNMVGYCVVMGNIRRSAEIAFGDFDDKDFARLKDYTDPENEYRKTYAYVSNNSLIVREGQEVDYESCVKLILTYGEPGFFYLDTARKFGRITAPGTKPSEYDTKLYADKDACGGNPCLEQTLEKEELCCLVETFPVPHGSVGDGGQPVFDQVAYNRTLRSALIYAKMVTTHLPHWPGTRAVMRKNRRIGCSMTGVAQFISLYGIKSLIECCDNGYTALRRYDRILSAHFGFPESIKLTSIKPSGTVSLLNGATPGMHSPVSQYYTRRIRAQVGSDMARYFEKLGYTIEPVETNPNQCCICFPVKQPDGIATVDEQTIEYQFEIAALLQEHWADNQVSCTITVDPEKMEREFIEAGDATTQEEARRLVIKKIATVLRTYEPRLKGISILATSHGYAQPVYEPITKEQYEEATQKIQPLKPIDAVLLSTVAAAPVADKGCDNDACVL